jgi:hypothetical protein
MFPPDLRGIAGMKSAWKLAEIGKGLNAEAMQIDDDGCNFGAIVQQLSINRSEPPVEKQLPGRIVQLLLHAEHAALISRDLSLRALYLEEIACLHTRRELLGHVKIGPKTVADIEEWLASKGRRLRHYNEDLSAVICSLRIKRRAPSNSACSITSDSRI